MSRPRTLVLTWGNPGRGDDGLGRELARIVGGPGTAIATKGISGEVSVSSDYQLQIEDAAEMADYERVVFVDADRLGPEPFSCRRLSPSETGIGFTSHSVTPGALLALTARLFDREPEAWLIGVRGYSFDEFDECLSARARANLAATAAFVEGALRSGHFEEVPARTGVGEHQSDPRVEGEVTR